VTSERLTPARIEREPDLSRLLIGLAQETTHAAESCAALQWSLSTLLDKVHHPDLGAEIHMLQDIDRVQQTLTDIAAILNALGPDMAGVAVSCDDLAPIIRLESLRQRLHVAIGLVAPLDTRPQPIDDDEVTWL